MLRDRTSLAHRDVESTISWERFFRDESNYHRFLGRYRTILNRIQGAIEATLERESVLLTVAKMVECLDDDERVTASWVRSFDRPQSGWEWFRQDVSQLEWAKCPAAGVGLAYVLVGSLNGGALLDRMAGHYLKFNGLEGRRFLAADGLNRRQVWLQTKDWIDKRLHEHEELQIASDSATRLFQYFSDHLRVHEA